MPNSNPQQQWTIDMKSELTKIVTYEDIRRAVQDLAEQGLIVDSGRKKWSKRTGQYEIVWMANPITRGTAAKSITAPLLM
jgi:hypothetical protein